MKVCKIITAVLVGKALLFFIGFSSGMAAEKPKPGGTFVVGIHADPDTLNPAIAPDAISIIVSASIFSRLIYADQNGNYHGDLAEKWTISKDHLKFEPLWQNRWLKSAKK